jgi:hypothetical protein
MLHKFQKLLILEFGLLGCRVGIERRSGLLKILMHDNLWRQNIMVVEWCCLCKKNGESIDHILLLCDVVRDIWSYFLMLFGVEWVMPRRVLDLLTSWGNSMGCGQAKTICIEMCLTLYFYGYWLIITRVVLLL